jgi:hypothetical protein
MRFELGALNPHPGGTGHFMGESGVEAAARRGLERQKREREEAERARRAAADDTISEATTIVGDVEQGDKSSSLGKTPDPSLDKRQETLDKEDPTTK